MPSIKPKVFAYLPQELYDRVTEFRSSRQLSSDSQALIAILEDYFGCGSEQRSPSANGLDERVARLDVDFQRLATNVGALDKWVARLDVEFQRLAANVRSVPGEPGETNSSSLPGEPGETNSSSLPGELGETNSSSLPGELKETNSSSLPGELKETNSGDRDVNEDDNRFILGLLGAGMGVLGYWKDFDAGFVADFNEAKIYKGETNAKRAVTQISKRFGLSESQSICYKPLSKFRQVVTA